MQLISVHYADNDNRKSKFVNFDGKSLICQQVSKKKLVDFCCNDIVAKSYSLLFATADFQP